MIDTTKLKLAMDQIELGRLDGAASLIMESGASGVELSLPGIAAAISRAGEEIIQEVEPIQQVASGGCTGCRGL